VRSRIREEIEKGLIEGGHRELARERGCHGRPRRLGLTGVNFNRILHSIPMRHDSPSLEESSSYHLRVLHCLAFAFSFLESFRDAPKNLVTVCLVEAASSQSPEPRIPCV